MSGDEPARLRVVRLVAMVAGLLGFVLAVLTPVLPVTQTTAQLNWPQDHSLNAVTAPLVSYAPTELDLSIPCTAVDRLAQQPGRDNEVLLSSAGCSSPRRTAPSRCAHVTH
ncbi:hypothetical protein G4X40_16810 [Rhodococcus sp. D2-41]|nr:hypothetical protein [Rhodococcus sp. D2-41]